MDVRELLRTEALRVVPEPPRWSEVASRAEMRRRRRLAIAVACSVVLMGVGAVEVLVDGSHPSTTSTEQKAPTVRRLFSRPANAGDAADLRTTAERVSEFLNPSRPLFAGGSQTTLESGTTTLGHPLYRPDMNSAPEVWMTNDHEALTQVGLRYGSTLVILYASWPEGTDVAARYQQLATEWESGYTTSISGSPAWVVPSRSDARGSIDFAYVTIGDVEVTLIGHMSSQDLVSLAGTLHG
jgi:hypothetical protein